MVSAVTVYSSLSVLFQLLPTPLAFSPTRPMRTSLPTTYSLVSLKPLAASARGIQNTGKSSSSGDGGVSGGGLGIKREKEATKELMMTRQRNRALGRSVLKGIRYLLAEMLSTLKLIVVGGVVSSVTYLLVQMKRASMRAAAHALQSAVDLCVWALKSLILGLAGMVHWIWESETSTVERNVGLEVELEGRSAIGGKKEKDTLKVLFTTYPHVTRYVFNCHSLCIRRCCQERRRRLEPR